MAEIPTDVLEFMNEPIIAHVGSHDENLHPAHAYVIGQKFSGKDSLTIFVPTPAVEKTLKNIQSNGRVSAVFAAPATHGAYQFKGTYRSHAPATPEDRAIQQESIAKLNALFIQFGYPENYMGPIKCDDSTAITFDVEEVFVQTPGPGAGAKVN